MIFLLIGFILLFVIAAGTTSAIYFSKSFSPQPTPIPTPQIPTPTPDPTANWKSYDGDGFTLKYPPTFQIKTDKIFDSIAVGDKIIILLNNSSAVNQDPNNKVSSTVKDISINGQFFKKITFKDVVSTGLAPRQSYVIYEVKYPSKKLYVTFTLSELPSTDWDKYDKDRISEDISQADLTLMEQILSTFKFTE